MNQAEIPTPAVLINLDQVDVNIRQMVSENQKFGIAHRPHIKAHKCVFLAKRQLALGAQGITCAKLGEAEVMAAAGITDILLAFPLIGSDKLQRLQALLEKGVQIRTIINSLEGAYGLSQLGEAINQPIEVLIEIDGGINRGGLKPGAPAVDFARSVQSLKGICNVGILYYGGGPGKTDTHQQIREKCLQERDEMVETAKQLRENGFSMTVLSGGSSFSSKNPDCLAGMTEGRAGNYIFNDVSQLVFDYARPEECALRVSATIISRPDAFSAIMDAGSKTLTSDLNMRRAGYGYIVEDPGVQIVKLNEEHGFLHSEHEIKFAIGDKISIIPNHACVVPNLADEMYGMRGGQLERMLTVDARGKNR
jgi:D-serine deaminase-like pyridoxal phosphate-dependent protein